MQVKECPILFSAPMVRAILNGAKTQTRRVVNPRHIPNPQPDFDAALERDTSLAAAFCPYGQPGDRLWVKEKHAFLDVTKSALSQFPLVGGGVGPDVWNLCVEYSDGTQNPTPSVEGDRPKQTRERGEIGWRPSIHMPRWASRITLEITGVRVERLHDISEDDAKAEGATFHDGRGIGHSGWRHDYKDVHADARSSFARLWTDINGAGSWAANPWVWAIEFRRVEQ